MPQIQNRVYWEVTWTHTKTGKRTGNRYFSHQAAHAAKRRVEALGNTEVTIVKKQADFLCL